MIISSLFALSMAVAQADAGAAAYPAAFFAAEQPSTAMDMVRLLPGFTFDQGDLVRGLGAAGNVLIDGERPASKDDPLGEILRRIPAADVLRIEVIRGSAPGIDMQGRTVLANIVRRRDGGSHMTLNAAAKATADGRLGWGSRLEASGRLGVAAWEGSVLAGRDFDDRAGWGLRTDTNSTGMATSQAREAGHGESMFWKALGAIDTPALGGKLHLNASASLAPFDYRQSDTPVSGGEAQIEHDHNREFNAELGARFERRLPGGLSSETYALQQFRRYEDLSRYAAPGDLETFTLNKVTGETILRSTVTARPNRDLSLRAGAEGDLNTLTARTDYVVNGADTSVPAADVHVRELRGEVFGETTWKAARSVTLESGLRLEASRLTAHGDVADDRSFLFAKPRLVVTWTPDSLDQFRLRVERTVGQLNFEDFTAGAASLANGAVQAGNPSLTPQQAWVFEAAVDRKFWGTGVITLTYRRSQISEVIDRAPIYDPAGTYDAPGNIGSGAKDEESIALTLPMDGLKVVNGVLSGRAVWRQSRVTDPTTEALRPMSGVRPFEAEAHFTQGLPALKANWGLDLFAGGAKTFYRFDEIDSDAQDPYLSVFAEYKPVPTLTVRLEVTNVTGHDVRHVREIWSGPRDGAPPDSVDVRDLHTSQGFYLRFRRTFG